MESEPGRRRIAAWGALIILLPLLPALGELATVHLKDGLTLRGDVALTDTELSVRNAAGVARYSRDRVDQIEWHEPPSDARGEGMRRLYALKPDDVAGYLELATWFLGHELPDEARDCCEHVLELRPDHEAATALLEKIDKLLEEAVAEEQAEGEAATEEHKGVSPPPVLSERDILRLKLSELDVDGPPERLNVRLLKVRDAPPVEELVRDEILASNAYEPEWLDVLDRGRPDEKLAVIVKTTGLEYADRIEVRGDPRVFSTYRRRVLPLVMRGCVRAGCHGGNTAEAFRFPRGSRSNDEFVYTSFVLLDQMNTAVGPMIDRGLPEASALVRYMLPSEQGGGGHKPVSRGRVRPVLPSRDDARYRGIVEWIASLHSPHPDYGLEYKFPAWYAPLSRDAVPLDLGLGGGLDGAEQSDDEKSVSAGGNDD